MGPESRSSEGRQEYTKAWRKIILILTADSTCDVLLSRYSPHDERRCQTPSNTFLSDVTAVLIPTAAALHTRVSTSISVLHEQISAALPPGFHPVKMSQNTCYLIAPADSGYTTPAIGTTAMCENVIKTANVQIQICYETVAGANLKKKPLHTLDTAFQFYINL